MAAVDEDLPFAGYPCGRGGFATFDSAIFFCWVCSLEFVSAMRARANFRKDEQFALLVGLPRVRRVGLHRGQQGVFLIGHGAPLAMKIFGDRLFFVSGWKAIDEGR